MTAHCRLYSNISQILLLYKTWRYYNKFDSTKSLGVLYRCVKIPQCGYMEYALKDIAFYVQKHITPCTVVLTSVLVRDKPLEAPASVKRVNWHKPTSFHMPLLSVFFSQPAGLPDGRLFLPNQHLIERLFRSWMTWFVQSPRPSSAPGDQERN